MTGTRSQSSGMQHIKQAPMFRKNVLPRSSEYKFEDGGWSEMLITNYKTRRNIFTFTILRTSNHTSLLNFVLLITYSYASNQCFPTCLPCRSPQNNFLHHKEPPPMKTITNYKKVTSTKIQSLLNYRQEFIVTCSVCVCVWAYIVTEIEALFLSFEKYFKFFEAFQNFKILMYLL